MVFTGAVHFVTAAAQESSELVAELLAGDMLTHSNTSVLLVDHVHRKIGHEADGDTELPPSRLSSSGTTCMPSARRTMVDSRYGW